MINEIRKGGEVYLQNISIGARYFLFTFQLVKQLGIVHIFGTDISKLQKAEEKAQEKKLWEALYYRAGEILHEVGNKTLIMLGNLDEIRYINQELEKNVTEGNTEQLKKLMPDLNQETKKAFDTLNIIQEIVDRMSQRKRQIIEKQEIKIFSLVTKSIEDEKYKVPTVDFVINCPDELTQATTKADEIHMGQILTNLLKNAEYAIRLKEKQIITINITDEKDFLILDIIDNGTGISDILHSRIFEDGYTTKGDKESQCDLRK